MSNAVSQGKPESTINVSLLETPYQCFITFSNKTEVIEIHDIGTGMGLKLLEDHITQGNGVLSFSQEKNKFTATVTLPVFNSQIKTIKKHHYFN